MCPQFNDDICLMIDLEPEHLECISEKNCLWEDRISFDVYISEFFFDNNEKSVP